MTTIKLQEWQVSEQLPQGDFSPADIAILAQQAEQTKFFELVFGHQHLSLKTRGMVGQCVLPLPDFGTLQLFVQPKVSVARLLEWWCWSEELWDLGTPPVHLETLSDTIEPLAGWLAERVLQQARRGLLSAYQRHVAPLASPKGRLLVRPSVLALAQGQPRLTCRYEERNQDIVENQILLWTLEGLRRRGIQHPEIRRQVQAAHRALQGGISIVPSSAQLCRSLHYTRLNQHYAPMHRLCGMILDQLSVSEAAGIQQAASFMLPMERVFESAVANALAYRLDKVLYVVPQERVPISDPNSSLVQVRMDMDLVIRERATAKPILVLDTKYKHTQKPSPEDIYQIISYATALGLEQAYLLYPHALENPLDCRIGKIHVKSLGVPMEAPVLDAVSPLVQLLQPYDHFVQSSQGPLYL